MKDLFVAHGCTGGALGALELVAAERASDREVGALLDKIGGLIRGLACAEALVSRIERAMRKPNAGPPDVSKGA